MTNDKDSAVLAPCPFCGGEAEVEQQGTNRQSHIIACTNCGCSLETWETWNAGSLWNTRQPTQSDALREKVARAIMLHHDIDPDVFIGMHGGYDHWLSAADAALAAINEIPRQPTQREEDLATALNATAAACANHVKTIMQLRAELAALRQPTQSGALREALEAAPLIGRTESVYDFMERQDAWLKGPYRAALQEQSK
jgi:transcription initiation factor TFIIIB Brf1 subunit/transcription initiation factor TFIIB